MSHTKNQELCSWKAVLESLRRKETAWRGVPLSRMDHLTYTEAIWYSAVVLNDLSNRYEGFGSKRDHVNWAMRMVSIDVGSLASFLSDAIVLWRQVSSPAVRETICNYADFKRQLSSEYPFAGIFFAPMREAIELFLQAPDPRLFYSVYQAISFLNHLTLTDIDMSMELENEYVEQEERLAALHLHPFLISRMREKMSEWFVNVDMKAYAFIPRHGPGGVAELKGDISLESKYRALCPDQLLEYVFRKHMNLDVDTFCPVFPNRFLDRTSRIVFVPKSMKTKRVISAEPATLQYFQQGIDRILREILASHPVLKRKIDLRDQSRQRSAALKASRYRQHATVDLSAASDSIHIDLVKQVFRDTPIYPFLIALRSQSAALPSGRVVPLSKYAPMGSAMTFPMQSLIFACILECTADYVHATQGSDQDLYDYRVYGDDIIVPEPCLRDLVVNLNWLGFRVNEGKTYGGAFRFRESCGCDAYDGVDVTPMRIGRKFTAKRVHILSPGILAGLVSMTNMAQRYEFRLLRRLLIDRMINVEPVAPMFSRNPDFGVYSLQPTNFHLRKEFNGNYQREEYRAGAVATFTPSQGTPKWLPGQKRFVEDRSNTCPGWDDIRYFEWLRRNAYYAACHPEPESRYPLRSWKLSASFLPGDGSHQGPVKVGNPKVYLVRRWSADWGFTSSVESEETITGMLSLLKNP